MLEYERSCYKRGARAVVGVDEAGRGPLAGPVVAACVLLPRRLGKRLDGLTDSKKLTEAQREHFFALIRTHALAVGVGSASPAEIDALNILQATFLAMRRAIAEVPQADWVLVDGNQAIRALTLPQQAIVKGDGLSYSIAAASVIAKVTRDRLMAELDVRYPAYGFAGHKGYPTAQHRAAVLEHGPCAEHRQTFLQKLRARADA